MGRNLAALASGLLFGLGLAVCFLFFVCGWLWMGGQRTMGSPPGVI